MQFVYIIVLTIFISVAKSESSRLDVLTACGWSPESCRPGLKFFYEESTTYKMKYSANIASSVIGISSGFNGLYLEADVDLTALTSCHFSIQLTKVDLKVRSADNPAPSASASGSQQMQKALEAHPIHFDFDDGAIETVCASSQDEPWVLNIKRGIVSMLQSKARDNVVGGKLLERDVLGDCPTEYVMDYHDWTSLVVTKTKKLHKCLHRSQLLSAIQSRHHYDQEITHGNSYQDSSFSCRQEIKDKKIERVSCKEDYLSKAFSNGESGVNMQSRQNLVMVDSAHSSLTKFRTQSLIKTSLLFNFDYNKKPSSDVTEVEDIFMKLCVDKHLTEEKNTPTKFYELVQLLSGLDVTRLNSVISKMEKVCKPRGEKIVFDVLPMINNHASLSIMTKIILDGKVDEGTKNVWLRMIALARKPTEDMLTAVLPLIFQSKPSAHALLSVSALANSFCQVNENCSELESIRKLVLFMEQLLSRQCQLDDSTPISTVILTLKSVGNLGLWSPKLLSAVENCATLQVNQTGLRVTAIEAYRKLPCSISREHLMRMLLKTEEDSEIQIAAYLQLIRCADRSLIDRMLKLIKDDNVSKQVKSFIWSHVKSVGETSDPCKKSLVALLEDALDSEDSEPVMDQDIRKFSRYFDRSLYSERLQLGGHLEGQLVYSSASFLPRSLAFNFSMDIFGHSVNLFELTARGQGLDLLGEALFRPEPSTLGNPVISKKKITQNTQGKIIHLPMEVSMSAQIFGQEIWTVEQNEQQINNAVNKLSSTNWASFMKVLSADDEGVSLNKNIILFDTKFIQSTATGFPLVLSFNSTANFHLKAGGKIIFNPQHREVEGRLRHVFTIVSEGAMTLDGYLGHLDTRLVTQFHSSLLLDGHIQHVQNEKLKIRLNFPEDKMDVVVVSSKVVLKQWEGPEVELKSDSADIGQRWEGCSGMESILGIKICGVISYPNASHVLTAPFFPLTGPTMFSMTLIKTDASLDHYLYHYYKQQEVTSESTSFLLSFNTPNSSVDREWTVHYSFIASDGNLNLRLISPLKKLELSGSYRDDGRRMQLTALLDVDRQANYRLESEVWRELKGQSLQITPKLSIHSHFNTLLLKVEGYANFIPQQQLTVNLAVEHLTLRPIIIKVSSNRKGKMKEQSEFNYDVIFNSPMVDANMLGVFSTDNGSLTWKTTINYQTEGSGQWETIEVNGKTRIAYLTTTRATANLDIHTSAPAIPDINVQWELELGEGYLGQMVAVKNERKASIFYAQHEFSYSGTLEDNKFTAKAEAKWPQVHFLFNVSHINSYTFFFNRWYVQPRILGQFYAFEAFVNDQSLNGTQLSSHVKLKMDQQQPIFLSFNISEEMESYYVIAWRSEGEPVPEVNVTLIYVNNNTLMAVDQSLIINATSNYWWSKINVHSDLYISEDKGKFMVDTQNQHKMLAVYERVAFNEYHGNLAVSTTKSGPVLTAMGRLKNRFDYIAEEISGLMNVEAIWMAGNMVKRRKLMFDGKWRSGYDIGETNLEVLWDAERDQSRRMLLSSYRSSQKDASLTSVKISYLQKEIVAEFTHAFQGQWTNTFNTSLHCLLQWDSIKRLGINAEFQRQLQNEHFLIGSLDLYTPLVSLEEIQLQGSHQDDSSNWKTNLSLVINRKWEFTMSSLGKDWRSANQRSLISSTNVTTPFEGLDRVNFFLDHFVEASKVMKTTVLLDWSQLNAEVNNIKLQINAIRPHLSSQKQAMASFYLQTPFQGLEDVYFIVEHALQNRKMDTWTKFEWNHVTIVYCGLHGYLTVDDENKLSVIGNITVQIPVDGLKNVSCLLNHTHESGVLSSELSGQWGINKMASVTIKGVRQISKLGAEFNVVIPSMKFGSSALYQRPTNTSILGVLKGHWDNYTSQLKVDGNYLGIVNFFYNVQLNTPFQHLDRVILAVKNEMEGKSIASNIKGQLGLTKAEVSVDGIWRSTGYSLGNFRCETPWKIFPKIYINAHHGRSNVNDPKLSTGIGGQWNNYTFHFNHSITFQSWMRFTDVMSLSLPFDGLENCSSIIVHSLVGKSLQDMFQLHAADSRLLSLTIEGELISRSPDSNKRIIQVLFKMDTSIWTPHGIELQFHHEDDGVSFKPRVFIKTMEPNNHLLDGTVSLISLPGEKWINVTIVDVGYLNTGFVIYGEEIAFTFKSSWWQLDLRGSVDIDFLAPRLFLDIKRGKDGKFLLDGHYDVWSSNKTAYFHLQKNDWKISVNGSGRFEINFLNGDLVMDIQPSVDFEKMILNISANGKSASNKYFKLNLRWANSKVILLNVGMQKKSDDQTMLTATVRTPVRWLKVADLVMTLDGQSSVESKIRWNRVHMVEWSCNAQPSQLKTSVTLSSTHPELSDFRLDVECTNLSKNKRLMTSFEIKNIRYKAEVDLKQSSLKTDLFVEFETPNVYSMNGSWVIGPQGGVGAIVITPQQTLNIIGNIKTAETSPTFGRVQVNKDDHGKLTLLKNIKSPLIEFIFEAEKPIGMLQFTRLHLSQKEIDSEFELQAIATTVTKENHKILAKYSTVLYPKLEFHIDSSMLGPHNPVLAEFGLKLNKNPFIFDLNCDVQVGHHSQHILELEMKNDKFRLVDVKAVVVSPLFLNATKINGHMLFEEESKGVRASFTVYCPEEYSVDMTYERDLSIGETLVSIIGVSPLAEVDEMRIIGKHRGQEWDNMEVSFELTTPIDGYETFKSSVSTAHNFGQNFQLDVNLRTPYVGYEEIIFHQSINYSIKALHNFGLSTTYRFDGYGVDIDGSCNKYDGFWYVDGNIIWWPLDQEVDKSTVYFVIDAQPANFRLQSSSSRWTLYGNGHFDSWKNLQATLTWTTDSKIGIELLNDWTENLSSHLQLIWANRTLTNLQVGSKNRGDYYFNFTTPFSVVQKLSGRGAVIRETNKFQTQANIVVNEHPLFDGILLWSLKENAQWTNKTVLFELDNTWQPIGIKVLTIRKLTVWEADACVMWDFTNRDLSSVGVAIQVNTTRGGRDLAVKLIHPKHKGQLKTGFYKMDSDFHHASAVNWGDRPLLFYNMSTSTLSDNQYPWKKTAKFIWEHPGRVITFNGLIFKRFTDVNVINLQTDLKLNRQEKGLALDLQYSHKSKVVLSLKHPKFEKNVELIGQLETRDLGSKAVDILFRYSPNSNSDVQIKMLLMNFGLEGKLMVLHPVSQLAFNTSWFTDKTNKLSAIFQYDQHQLIVDAVKSLDGQSNLLKMLAGDEHQMKTLLSISLTRNVPQNVSLLVVNPWMTTTVNIDIDSPLMTILHNNSKGQVMTLQAGLDSATMKRYLYQTTNIGNCLDATFILHLNSTRLLTARGYWTPGIVGNFKHKLVETVSAFSNVTSQWGRVVWTKLVNEMTHKSTVIISGVKQVFTPIAMEMKNEINSMLGDASVVQERLMEMYKENDFFIQDIWPLIESVYHSFRDYFSYLMDSLSRSFAGGLHWTMANHLVSVVTAAWEQWFQLMTDILNKIWTSLFELTQHIAHVNTLIYNKIADLMAQIPTIFNQWMANISASNSRLMTSLSSLLALGEKLKLAWNTVWNLVLQVKDWLQDLLGQLKNWITNNSIYKFFRYDLWHYAWQTVVELYHWSAGLFNKCLLLLKKYMAEQPKVILENFLTTIWQVLNKTWTLITQDANNWVQTYVIRPTVNIYRKWMWCVHYLELWPPQTISTVFKWYSYWSDLFSTPAEVFADGYNSPNYVTINPEDGRIEMDQLLPFPWRNFKQQPQIGKMKEIVALAKIWSAFNPSDSSERPSFLTKYYQLADHSQWSWLPPFTGQALVVGKQHFVSFDGRVTEFSGNCNYILTKDFLDGNFSVVINYEDRIKMVSKSSKWSLTVEVDGGVVQLLPDYRVFVNEKKVELPTTFGYTSIKREESKVILTYEYGLEIVCFWNAELCKVQVSGWYFSRLNGMLGTYNYEAWDDRKTLDGLQTENDLSWGKSWSVGSCLSKHTNVAFNPTENDPELESYCEELFNSSTSMFRHCYTKISPASFIKMCLNDVRKSRAPESVCGSAQAYVETCKSAGVAIRMARQCVHCHNVNGMTLREGGNITINASSHNRAADVVFIIEAKKCNRGVVAMFKDLVLATDMALQQVGVLEKRFAVVVFGGSPPLDNPHIATLDNDIFSRQWTSVSMSDIQLGRGSRDVFDAVKYASKLSFHPGASKIFVVATCSSGELLDMRPDYPEVHRMLLEDGITLHLLLDREFGIKKPNQFYGLDGVAAFTSKDSRTSVMKGDQDLRRQVAPPKDLYVPIALESNGSVFSSLHLSPEQPKRNRKLFLDSFSRRVAQSAEVDVCHTCDCLPDEDGVGHLYCQPCVFPKPAHVYMHPDEFFSIEYGSIYQKYNPDTYEESGESDLEEEERRMNRPQFNIKNLRSD